MTIKVLNPKTNRYNALSSMTKPALKKIAKTMSGKKLPVKVTKVELGKIISKSCSSRMKSYKPVKKTTVKKSSSKCKVKRHTKSVGKGKSKHTVTIKRYSRKC